MGKTEVCGELQLRLAGQETLGNATLRLLEKVRAHGSIAQAAKAAGISYKTAWDLLNRADNLSPEPLLVKLPGGPGGGGTRLTPAGERLLFQYHILEEEHRKVMAALSERLSDFDQSLKLFRRISMRLSARNVLSGTVSRIRSGAVNAEVTLTLPGGEAVAATITLESADSLGLKPGVEAYAVIKASSIILGVEAEASRLSCRNVIAGTISRLTPGAVNTEVELEIAGRRTLCAIITRASAERLKLSAGMKAAAIFKASSVILGVA